MALNVQLRWFLFSCKGNVWEIGKGEFFSALCNYNVTIENHVLFMIDAFAIIIIKIFLIYIVYNIVTEYAIHVLTGLSPIYSLP